MVGKFSSAIRGRANMSYAKWALLKTVGNLAGNQAYYAERMRQLQVLQGASSKHVKPFDNSPGIEALMPAARAEFAESVYGPSNLVWENKIRAGIIKAHSELSFLKDKRNWSNENCYRFLEICTFLIHVQNDPETMRDIMRLDMRLGDEMGLLQMKKCFEIIQQVLEGPHSEKITECSPRMELWREEVFAHPDMTYVLAEARFAVIGQPDNSIRGHGEFHLPPTTKTINSVLTKCSDCGGKVSKNAKCCPHCGNPNIS